MVEVESFQSVGDVEPFPRTQTIHQSIYCGEGSRDRLMVCSGRQRIQQKILLDLRHSSEKLYRDCKNGPHPRTIGTKVIGKRGLSEPNAFFGSDFVSWLIDNLWCSGAEEAMFLCRNILFKNDIIRPVYPFIKHFFNDTVLYKFVRDIKKIEEDPRTKKTYKMATDICARKLQDQARRSQRNSLDIDKSPVLFLDTAVVSKSKTPSPNPSPKPAGRSRRSSSSGSSSDYTNSSSVYIAGNMLLSMIDKFYQGSDGELDCQLMLRHGFMSPVCSDSMSSDDISKKQVFYPQEKYKFSPEIVRSVNKLATKSTARSRRPSTLTPEHDPLGSHMTQYAMETVTSTLDVAQVLPGAVMERQVMARRSSNSISIARCNRPSFFQKFKTKRKTSN